MVTGAADWSQSATLSERHPAFCPVSDDDVIVEAEVEELSTVG
jgi:hypothetical protein